MDAIGEGFTMFLLLYYGQTLKTGKPDNSIFKK